MASTPKQKVELGATQETLLLPLVGRANETKKKEGLVKDTKAVEIVEALDYDFSKFQPFTSHTSGMCFRSVIFDEDVNMFLRKYPTGTVIEIGCGLNTRYERIDNGQATWIDIDMPDSMALRQQFFDYSGQKRRSMIAASILDKEKWMPQVKATGGPWCFVSEAVLIYLEVEDVRPCIENIAKEFADAWLIIDTTGAKMAEAQSKSPLMKLMKQEAGFRWKCDTPKETIEAWTGERLVQMRQRTFFDADPKLLRLAPAPHNTLGLYVPTLLRWTLPPYYFNVFVPRKDLPLGSAALLSSRSRL